MAKNIINQEPRGRGGTAQATPGFWAPSDGSRTNMATLRAASSFIPEQGQGWGIRYDLLNFTDKEDDFEVVNIENDVNVIVPQERRRWQAQRDKEYLDFVTDSLYNGGCMKIIVKKTCWLRISGSAVIIGGALGSGTETSGICIMRRRPSDGDWYEPRLASGVYTNEPGGRGMTLRIDEFHPYQEGEQIKIAIMTTYQTEVKPQNVESGSMWSNTYLEVTRMSDF